MNSKKLSHAARTAAAHLYHKHARTGWVEFEGPARAASMAEYVDSWKAR